jgi:hypothetical protein
MNNSSINSTNNNLTNNISTNNNSTNINSTKSNSKIYTLNKESNDFFKHWDKRNFEIINKNNIT